MRGQFYDILAIFIHISSFKQGLAFVKGELIMLIGKGLSFILAHFVLNAGFGLTLSYVLFSKEY